ncbi:MAG: DUF983 domain-containing protein [Methyloligellaceae bacterium]
MTSPYTAGIRGRCPECAGGALFDGYLTVAGKCSACGLDYGFADSGDGPAIFIMLIAGFIVVGGALIVEILYQPSYWVHAMLWLPLTVVLCLGLLRPFKGVLIALQYHHKAEEGRLAGK